MRLMAATALAALVTACAGGDQVSTSTSVPVEVSTLPPTTEAASPDTTSTPPTSPPTTAAADSTTTTDSSPPSTEPAASVEPPPDLPDWQSFYALTEAAVFETGGVTLEFEGIRFGDLSDAPSDEREQLEPWLDAGTVGIVILNDVTVSNGSGTSIDFFPDQGTLLIGDTQIDASFLSPSFTGNTGSILDGAVVTHDILFESPITTTELAPLGSGRYVANGPWDAETIGLLGDEPDITFSW